MCIGSPNDLSFEIVKESADKISNRIKNHIELLCTIITEKQSEFNRPDILVAAADKRKRNKETIEETLNISNIYLPGDFMHEWRDREASNRPSIFFTRFIPDPRVEGVSWSLSQLS